MEHIEQSSFFFISSTVCRSFGANRPLIDTIFHDLDHVHRVELVGIYLSDTALANTFVGWGLAKNLPPASVGCR